MVVSTAPSHVGQGSSHAINETTQGQIRQHLYTVGVAVAPAVGPVLGGWLTDEYGALDGLTGRLATSSGLPPGVAEDSAIKYWMSR